MKVNDLIRRKKIVRLSPQETKIAMSGVRGFLKNGAVSPTALKAFTKFLATEKGQVWARENLIHTRIKKGSKR